MPSLEPVAALAAHDLASEAPGELRCPSDLVQVDHDEVGAAAHTVHLLRRGAAGGLGAALAGHECPPTGA